MAPPDSLNSTPTVSPTSELITETAEIMIWESVLQELEKWKAKLVTDQKKQKTNLDKVISPFKRKSKFINGSSKEKDKRKKF